MLYWLANHNFFNKYTFIRNIQCKIFGHNWFTVSSRKKNDVWTKGCAWCGNMNIGEYPKMRERRGK